MDISLRLRYADPQSGNQTTPADVHDTNTWTVGGTERFGNSTKDPVHGDTTRRRTV
jgi:hypothetical protein